MSGHSKIPSSTQSMMAISDERLMAYADGELSGADRRELDQLLAQSAELRARLAAFAATGRQLSTLFDAAMQTPVPQRLIDAVLAAPAETERADTANVVQLDGLRRVPRTWSSSRIMSLAAAACIAVVGVGIGARSFLTNHSQSATSAPFGLAIAGDGRTIAGRDLASALDTLASNREARNSGSGSLVRLKPVLSFATATGVYCRQYKILGGDAHPSFMGVACRDGGTWRVEAHEAFVAKPGADNQIVVAESDVPAAVDAAVGKLIAGDVLSADDEAAAVQQQWRPRH